MTKRIRNAVFLIVIAVMLLGLVVSPASAHWGSSRHIHVKLKSDNWNNGWWNPHINSCTVTVKGPGVYYSAWVYNGYKGLTSKTVDFVKENLNTGTYTITVKWWPYLDSKSYQYSTQSGTLSWVERADAYTFQSP